MRKLMMVGDAACPSGFAKGTHYTLDTLKDEFDVSVIGINYRGDPHGYPYPIYPAQRATGDFLGLKRIVELSPQINPDVILLQNDPWQIVKYMKVIGNACPVVAIVAIDGKNVQGRQLNGLAGAIFWTQFGLDEARKGGYTGPATVIPLGVDTTDFYPCDKLEARRSFKLERLKDHFIVGNVNRNQPRKRLDLTISYFAEWVKEYKIPDAALFLHVAPTGDSGYDCPQLMSYYGVLNRLILMEPEPWLGVPTEQMRRTYSAMDLNFTTTQGEGMGLTQLEAMACRRAVLGPDWSALGDWAKGAARLVRCSSIAVTTDDVNIIGGVMDREECITALNDLYRNRNLLDKYAAAGYDLVTGDRFNWKTIGRQVGDFIDECLSRETVLEKKAVAVG